MAEPATGPIFISYRRDETAYAAGWLFNRLAERYGEDQIFKDVDSIELGDDFVEVITRAVSSTDVLLALIGDTWITVTDDAGRRRLDDPEDFVRLEIEAALAREIRVIPILVDGAEMPDSDKLPPSLAGLARRQALELSPARFDFDTGRLLKVLDRGFEEIRLEIDGGATGSGHTAASEEEDARKSGRGEALTRWRERLAQPRVYIPLAVAAILVVAAIAALIATSGSPESSSASEPPSGASFTDDFSTESHGWSGGKYEDGAYVLSARRGSEGSATVATPVNASFPGDIRVAVDARKTGGSATVGFGYGLFCRAEGSDTYYAFDIWHTHAAIMKVVNGAAVGLGAPDSTIGADADDDPSKRLEAVCKGTTQDGRPAASLQLLVDGRLLLSRQDADNPLVGEGYGLLANMQPPGAVQASESDRLDVTFNNFEVSK